MKFGHLLLFAVLVSLQATATELVGNLVRSAQGSMPMVKSSSGEIVSGGCFYGYRNASTGPGDFAFKEVLAAVDKYHAPLVMLLDLGGASGNSFCTAANNDVTSYEGGRYLLQFMNQQKNAYNTLFCYFRGSQSGPPAVEDAWDFAKSLGAPNADLVYVCYYRYKDGTYVSQVGQNSGSLGSFKGIATFGSRYNLAKDTTSEIRATAAFGCGSGLNSGLQMVSNETETVYVPFVRKENLTNVETNWLAVTYPGETVASTNIQFVWAATGPAATNLEVAVSVTNGWGGTIRLEYLNQDGISFLTNWISSVTVTNGTFDSPWMPGEKTAEDLNFGEWTLDFACATNRARQTGGVTVAVLGSPVWTDVGTLFGPDANHAVMMSFCENANATLAVIDHADTKGASLFSHVIEDGWSGTPFLSRHGFSLADAAVTGLCADHNRLWGEYQTENDADRVEVAVFRTDGTRVGMLKIQRTASGEPTNWTENMARLQELIDTANGEYESDRYEDVNNKPQAGVGVIGYEDSGVTTATNTLSISDRCDFFKLTGLAEKTPLQISLVDCNEGKRTQKSGIAVSVVCVTDAKKGAFRVVEPVPCSTNNVWSFSAAEIDSAFVRVTAWEEKKDTGDLASAEGSKVAYRVQVAKAKDEVGTVMIDTASETVEVTESEMPFPIVVSRSGYTGAVKATLTLDTELSTAPTTSYQFPDEGVSFSWGADMDFGLQTNETSLVLLNKGDWDEGGDIVLKLDVTEGAVPLVGTNRLWVTVTQRENPSDPTGKIVIGNPSTAERVYLEEGSKLPVRIDRIGGKRGQLAVKITTTDGGQVELPDGSLTNRLDWKRYETTSKSVAWTLPALSGKMSKWDMTLRLTGIEGTPVASNTLNVCVLPAGALKPEMGDYRAEVSQYCELKDAKVKFTGTVPAGATLTPTRISGSLPSGVKMPTVDAATNLVFSGVSSKPGTYVSIWWLTVKNEKRQVVGYSYPVKVTIDVKALVEKDKSGKVIGGLNPTFAKARTWTSLPLVDNASGRLEGLLDLTVSTTGKMTARYRKHGGKTVSFSAGGLTDVDLESGLANAEAEASGCQLKVRLYKDTSVAGDIYGPGIALYLHFETKEGSVAWSKDRTAEAWKGNYTLAFAPAGEAWDEKTLCFGSPVLQLKFTSKSQWNSGKVTYAGYLPNGKTVSGSATLVEAPTNAVTVTLPIFATSATDTLSTIVDLNANTAAVEPSTTEVIENQQVAWSCPVTSYWDHVELNVPELSYKNLYLPFGSKFVDEGWKAADFKQAVEGATSASYNKTSGLVSGSLRRTADGKTVTENWKAVVTPGWEVFLAGASWRNVSTNAVNDATGKPVRRTVQVGESVEVDAE